MSNLHEYMVTQKSSNLALFIYWVEFNLQPIVVCLVVFASIVRSGLYFTPFPEWITRRVLSLSSTVLCVVLWLSGVLHTFCRAYLFDLSAFFDSFRASPTSDRYGPVGNFRDQLSSVISIADIQYHVPMGSNDPNEVWLERILPSSRAYLIEALMESYRKFITVRNFQLETKSPDELGFIILQKSTGHVTLRISDLMLLHMLILPYIKHYAPKFSQDVKYAAFCELVLLAMRMKKDTRLLD